MKIRTLPLRIKAFRTTKLALLVCHFPSRAPVNGRTTPISRMQVLVAVEQVDVEELNDLVCAITDPEN
jgi:hypothetical protein